MSAKTTSLGSTDALLEAFTARRALETCARTSPELRRTIARERAVARQRADSAESLWASGHAAEALRLVVDALENVVTAARDAAHAVDVAAKTPPPPTASAAAADEAAPAPESDRAASDAPGGAGEAGAAEAGEVEAPTTAPHVVDPAIARGAEVPLARVLTLLGVPATRAEALATDVDAARRASLPMLDAEIAAAHGELYQRASSARLAIDRALGAAGMERREIVVARASRIALAALALVGAVAIAAFALHEPEGTQVTASATWADAPAFGPEAATDGRADTFWLLPDGSEGWLDVRFSPGRRIEHVRVQNTSNPPHGDRATRDYRIELYVDGRVARTIDGTFEYSTDPQPIEHAVGLDDVERVRFTARSFHRTGAGLAELAFD